MFLRKLIQKIGLIFILVFGFHKVMNAVFVFNSAIMPRGDIVRAEFFGVTLERSEFYLAVTKNVGVRRSSLFVLLQKVPEYPVVILFCKIHAVIRNSDSRSDPPYVGVIGFGGTTTVVVGFFPIVHKQAYNVIALFFK